MEYQNYTATNHESETEVPVTNDATPVTVAPEPVSTETKAEEKRTGTVNCGKLNLRARASKSSDILSEINQGEIVTIDEKKSSRDWLAVTTQDGNTGFCMSRFITE